MKLISILTVFAAAILLCSCSKGEAPDDGSPQPPAGGGGTTQPAPYVVRTMGINIGLVTIDTFNKVRSVNLTNGFGNRIRVDAGTTGALQLELMNANTDPRIEPDRYIPRLHYPNVKRTGTPVISQNVVAADSTDNLYFRVRGFDYARTGFHQLNLILCDDNSNPPGPIAISYNSPDWLAPSGALLTTQGLKALINVRFDRTILTINNVTIN